MWQAENFDQADWIGVVALDLKETFSQLSTILNSISHQHLKHAFPIKNSTFSTNS